MAVKQILRASKGVIDGSEESILRTDFVYVEKVTDEILNVVTDLKDTLHSDDLSVGLAAPQIGCKFAVIVVNLNKSVEEDRVFINPRLVNASGKKEKKYESCMSIPHKRGLVQRRKKVVVEYMDLSGEPKVHEASGFESRVLQHEIDHLNGILYTDKINESDSLEDTDLFRDHGIT